MAQFHLLTARSFELRKKKVENGKKKMDNTDTSLNTKLDTSCQEKALEAEDG